MSDDAMQARTGWPALSLARAAGLWHLLRAVRADRLFLGEHPRIPHLGQCALILLQVSVIGIIAIGMTFTIITAGIDLSVGSLLAIAGIFSGQFAQRDPTPANVAIAFVLPIVVGVLGGALNGAMIAGAGVNPLIVTLGTLTAFRGFVVWYRVNPIYDLQPYYRIVGQGSLFGVPVPVIILALVAVAASLVLSYTRFGRYVYAVGGNREAARAAGINVGLMTFSVYVISGLCVGIAALIFTSRLMAAQAISGHGFRACRRSRPQSSAGRRCSAAAARSAIRSSARSSWACCSTASSCSTCRSQSSRCSVGSIIIVSVWLDGVLRKRRRMRIHGR